MSNINLQTTDAIKGFKELNNISTLKVFNISGNSLPLHAADYLAEFSSKNTELQELDLSNNDLQESGISAILGAIKCSNFTKLNISKNNANLKGVVEVLSCSTKLVELNLSYNRLTDAADATQFFSESKNIFGNLEIFSMCSVCQEINEEAATALANVFSQNSKLKELDLSDNNICTEAIIKIMSKLNTSTSMTKFIISHNNITDYAADYIATFLSNNANVEVLDLSHNNLLSAGTIKICKTNISKLITFKINHNCITVEAANDIASFLSHNKKLQVLDLSCNDLQESGCKNIFEALQDNCILTSLKIGNCHATDKTADEIANVLLNNPGLEELDLSCNNISTCFVNIFKGMKNISNLVSIDISHNTITDDAVDDLVYIFLCNTSLQVLDLSYNNLSTSDTAKIFQGMKNISKLEAINIGHNMITDEAADSIAAVLSRNSNLQVLNMSFNCLGSEGCIKIFNGMKNASYLRNIDISNNKITCEASENIAAVLFQNTKMEKLDISYNNLQTPGAIEIFQGIKHTSTLTKFNIAHNRISDDATNHILDILYNCSKLKEFNLCDNTLLEIKVITKLIVSKVTKFDNLINEQTANKLSIIITSLQELDLSNINLQTEGAIKLFEELGNISTLTKFDVSENCINPLAASNLGKFLLKNYELQELNLSHNDLQVAGIKTILSEIKISKLTTLNISANNVNLCETVEVLTCAANLTELNLSYNKLNNAADATWFFSMLKNIFINLIKLNISCICHEINDEAAEELANIFSQSNRLEVLDLSRNGLQDDGVIKICSSSASASLISVDFRYNNITPTAAEVIEFYLQYNRLQLQILL